MGLAAPSNKVRVGLDPRNTAWANDTDRFGHQQMLRMGWKPGKGLGYSRIGSVDHVKVKVKKDNVGLGKPKGDDQPHGLDAFQALLGKLNGNEAQVERQMAEKKIQSGEYLNFVYGGVLEGTIEHMLASQEKKKRALEQEDEKKPKKLKTGKEKKHKDKKTKKEKRDKKDKKSKSGKDKHEKKDKKVKKEKKSKKDQPSDEKAKELEASESTRESSPAPRGIRATRNKFIAMKRQATSDAKGLREILMLG